MATYKKLGKLKHPPLVYSMAVVLINLQSIKSYIQKIQDELRNEYPGFASARFIVGASGAINPLNQLSEETVDHYILNSADLSWGIVLTKDRIVLQTVAYEDFGDFGKRFKAVLDRVKNATNLKYHSGIAFRHIDNIKPVKPEKGLADFLNKKYLIPDLFKDDCVEMFHRQESRYKFKSSFAIARLYAFYNESGPRVPIDLLPYYSALNPNMIDTEVKAPYALGDFEANQLLDGKSEEFNTEKIIADLDKLHQSASLAFRGIMSPDALTRRR